jgi:hypothetical protein
MTAPRRLRSRLSNDQGHGSYDATIPLAAHAQRCSISRPGLSHGVDRSVRRRDTRVRRSSPGIWNGLASPARWRRHSRRFAACIALTRCACRTRRLRSHEGRSTIGRPRRSLLEHCLAASIIETHAMSLDTVTETDQVAFNALVGFDGVHGELGRTIRMATGASRTRAGRRTQRRTQRG